MVWMNILLSIEEAHDCDIPLSGLVCDIVKALINCVSRSIIFELAAMMRLPGHILVGWAGAVSSLIRHFQIRDNFSQGTHSCTGFAEGDGLSCVAMQLLDCLLHWWMDALQAPLSDSYVCG